MISGKYLVGLVDEFVFVIIIVWLSKVVLEFMNIHLWYPRVSVHYREHNVLYVYSVWLKKLFLKMFNTPRHVRSFSFLLILSHLMNSVSEQSKFVSALFADTFSLFS